MSPIVALVGFAIAIGVVGTLFPVLPGLWLVWAACLSYGLVEGFSTVGAASMTLITLLALAGTALAFVVPQRSAAGQGISVLWQGFAAVLAVIGFFVIPVVGAIVGFVLGVSVGAYAQTRDVGKAAGVTITTLRGVAVAAGLQFTTALLMAVVWLVWVIWG